MRGGLLMLKSSEPVGDGGTDTDRVLESFLKRFVSDPLGEAWFDRDAQAISLQHVFGWSAILPYAMVLPGTEEAALRSISVTAHEVEIGVYAPLTKRELLLRLNPAMEFTAAKRDGVSLPLLVPGFTLDPVVRPWLPGNGKQIYSPGGPIDVLDCGRGWARKDESGKEIPIGRTKAVVVVATWDLWIGPEDCVLAYVEGNLIGIMFDAVSGELSAFAGPHGRLARSRESAAQFRAAIARFESEFEANAYRCKPQWKKAVRELFVDDTRFQPGCEFTVRKIDFRGQEFVVTLNTSNPEAFPEITLGPDLKRVSTRVLAWDAPEISKPSRLRP